MEILSFEVIYLLGVGINISSVIVSIPSLRLSDFLDGLVLGIALVFYILLGPFTAAIHVFNLVSRYID